MNWKTQMDNLISLFNIGMCGIYVRWTLKIWDQSSNFVFSFFALMLLMCIVIKCNLSIGIKGSNKDRKTNQNSSYYKGLFQVLKITVVIDFSIPIYITLQTNMITDDKRVILTLKR